MRPEYPDLTPNQIERLLAWQGYGNTDGRFWFIGMEEGGDPSRSELRERADQWDIVEDLGTAPRSWDPDFAEESLPKLNTTSTWRIMCKIALNLTGERGWADNDMLRDYQARRLGRHGGETFLTEVFPIPAAGLSDWSDHHHALFGSRELYMEKVRDNRISLISKLWIQSHPEYTFCYGKSYWPVHKMIFHEHDFRTFMDGKLEIAAVGDSKVILTEFFDPSVWGTGRGIENSFIKEMCDNVVRA